MGALEKTTLRETDDSLLGSAGGSCGETEEEDLQRALELSRQSHEEERTRKRRWAEANLGAACSEVKSEEQLLRKAIEASLQEQAAAKATEDEDWRYCFAPPLTTAEFVKLWRCAEADVGSPIEEIEEGSLVRAGNNVLKGSSQQSRAQYGRFMFGAMQRVAEIASLKRSDVFLDIGSGVGNAVMQIACTVGCESWGIEIMHSRHIVADAMWASLRHALSRRTPPVAIGDCHLEAGDLVHCKRKLVQADVAFVNNFNEIFGARGCSRYGPTLDDHIAAIFAAMKPGSRLVSLEPLHALGMSLNEANAWRESRGLPPSPDASFFKHSIHRLEPFKCEWTRDDDGLESVASWSNRNYIDAHLYVRTEQSAFQGQHAAFLCTGHTSCAGATEATRALDNDTLSLVTACVYCDAPRRACARRASVLAASSLRTQPRRASRSTDSTDSSAASTGASIS